MEETIVKNVQGEAKSGLLSTELDISLRIQVLRLRSAKRLRIEPVAGLILSLLALLSNSFNFSFI